MSRVEENKEMIEAAKRKYDKESLILKTNEAAKRIHLGAIVVILGDISQSLAVIADALSTERNKEHE